MPKLIELYICQVIIGFIIAAAFVAGLLWFNVGGLWHLVSNDGAGVIAVAMLWVSNGIVFAGVQFGIRVMMMAEDRPKRGGGRPIRVDMTQPVRVQAKAAKPDLLRRRK
jgi:hypothetical protein